MWTRMYVVFIIRPQLQKFNVQNFEAKQPRIPNKDVEFEIMDEVFMCPTKNLVQLQNKFFPYKMDVHQEVGR